MGGREKWSQRIPNCIETINKWNLYNYSFVQNSILKYRFYPTNGSRFENQTENILFSRQNNRKKRRGKKKFTLRYSENSDRKIFRNKNFPTEIYIILDRNDTQFRGSDIFQEKIKIFDYFARQFKGFYAQERKDSLHEIYIYISNFEYPNRKRARS